MLMTALMVVGCTTQNGVDPRDELVGSYHFTTDGQLVFTVFGETETVPINGDGQFTISKSGEKNKVVIAIFNDSVYATLNKNELRLDDDSYSVEFDGTSVEAKVSNDKIQIAEKKLSWETDLEAVIKYNGIGIVGRGPFRVNAEQNAENKE